MKRNEKSLNLWNKVAWNYADSSSSLMVFHRSIYLPAVEMMMGNVNNKTILDAGCGNGVFTKKLADSGAKVMGIDGSEEMIYLACRDNAHSFITYAVMDLTEPLGIESKSTDIILANMVLMDLCEIDTCISEFSRILKPDGVFVFSIVHPSFFCSDWISDESGPRSYKKVHDYLNHKSELLNFWGETLHYHRPLSFYFQVLEKNKMCVLSMQEPILDVPENEKDPIVLSHLRIPSFLVIKAMITEKPSNRDYYTVTQG